MTSETEELLFFDTFSHDASEEINLDLVQFPKPVILSEIRIIPLGARVQADFPGGVRLGATNPSQFHIEFFVNDLSNPGASTFESLGGLEYKQNLDIQFECVQRKIPTDGLVLRGWYTTITLALYGVLSKTLDPPLVPQVPVPPTSLQDPRVSDVTASAATAEWVQQHSQVPQTNIYIEQQYGYTAEYQDTAQQPHGYESWPVQPVPATTTIPSTTLSHPDHYRPPAPTKVYEQGQWSDEGNRVIEKKAWEHGKERLSNSPERDWTERKDSKLSWDDERDDDRDSRSKDKYWSEDNRNNKQRTRDKDDDRRKDWRDDKERYSRRRDDDRYKDRKSRDEDKVTDDDRGSRDERNRLSWSEAGNTDSRTRSKSYRETSWERDREKSPYSEGGTSRRRPRSPPSRSPKRPATPSERYWSPEHNKDYVSSPSYPVTDGNKRRHTTASPLPRSTDVLSVKVDLTVQSPQTPLESPDKSAHGPSPGVYNHSPEQPLDYEQFEPILSDEDIMDEPDSQFADVDFDFPDDMEEVVKQFNPFTFQIKPLNYFLDPSMTECEKERVYLQNKLQDGKTNVELRKLEKLVGSVDTSTDVTEDWVLNLEQILPSLDKSLACLSFDSDVVKLLLNWVDIGLDFDRAMLHAQLGFKVRHIKAGVRLVGGLCCDETLLIELVTKRNIQWRLLELFHQNYMALPIKLLLLNSLDLTLLNPVSVQFFINEKYNGVSCYQRIINMLEVKQLSRVKFALMSILNKIHVYELMSVLKNQVAKIIKDDVVNEEDKTQLILSLQQVIECYNNAQVITSQPKRFFPVSVQFEINVNNFSYRYFYKYMKHHKLIEILLILFTNSNTCLYPGVLVEVQNVLEMLSTSHHGLCFLSSQHNAMNHMLKLFYQSEDYVEDVIPGTLQCLGVILSCRLQTLQYLDQLMLLNNSNDDDGDVFDVLHNMFMITFSQFGKSSLASVLSLDNNLNVLLRFLKTANKKSAVRGYIYDLIILTVKYSDNVEYLKKYSKVLIDLAENDKSCKLYDNVLWLKPLENPNFFDDVQHACEIIKKFNDLENCHNLPGDLITSLRVIKYLSIPNVDNYDCKLQNDETFVELKYKYSILQLYSLDGVSILSTILTKILEYYEQPFSQAINLLSWQGTNLILFVEPAIQLLRKMLTYVITARNNEFKDLTCVSVLIQTYTLLLAYPTSSESFTSAQKVCRDIVETLLAYTLPVVEITNENEALSKTLWTQMVAEVLKYITTTAFSFIPGFTLLSELLPLPIPVQTNHELKKHEIDELVNCRKLWSLHLHTLTPLLHDLIVIMGGSSYQPLLQLVRRVCVQLSDLSSITALTISRALLDPLLSSLQRPQQQPQLTPVWETPCTNQSLRFLNFLASLMTHPSVKSAVLSLITVGSHNIKSDERFLNLVNAFTTILRSANVSTTHVQCQEFIILIIQCLFDAEVTLVPITSVSVEENSSCSQTSVFFANSLPSRDLMGTLLSALLDHVSISEHSFSTVHLALKTFLMLTEHDYGFYHLKNCLEMKIDCLWNVLIKLCNNISKDNTESLNVVNTLFELLRELTEVTNIDDDTLILHRTISMNVHELLTVVKWDWKDGEKLHPILHLESLLKEWSSADETLATLNENIAEIIKMLNEAGEKPMENKEISEPVLPPAQSLATQFASRLVYVIVDVEDHRLTSLYWLTPPQCDDTDQEMDQISCDLIDLGQQYLPDLHITHEVERVCMLKVSEEEDENKKGASSKYNFTGLRTRRPFITPMRGRGVTRATTQRGDLFRSRPPNTSRPPSLHVDDFVALETCGQQPTGPTGYNKISMRAAKDIIAARVRGRGRAYAPERGRFFGASTYPRRESIRGLPTPRGRATWISHTTSEDLQYHASVTEQQSVRFVSRGPSWSVQDARVRTRPFTR